MLRDYLGGHRNFGPGQLHKEEVASLVIRAGRAAGFTVRTEVGAPWVGLRHAMDCGWYHPASDALIVIWEFDGHDASATHMRNIARKLAGCGAVRKYAVLYSVKNDLTPKPPSKQAATRAILPGDVEIITDVHLMRPPPNGIDAVMDAARRVARMP